MKQQNVPTDRFVVFEGIDGSGTTTQTQRLYERLRVAGRPAWLTSEPTDRPIGLIARRVLSGDMEVSPETVAYIFAADRSDHLSCSGGIVERLTRGEIVVCDRYTYSSRAYQSIQASPELVESLNARFPAPGIVFFLDLPVAAMEERLAGRERRDIYEHLEFQERVRERYLRVLAESERETRVVTIDATAQQEQIGEKVWETLERTSIL